MAGKLMETLTNQYVKDDRLPTLISGTGGVKLLGVPPLPPATERSAGDLISTETLNLVDQWKCRSNISAMVFDTTAANTGHLTAGCICIQEKLGRALLWCACRHHVGELILSKVWNTLDVEVSRNKDVTIFLKFRDAFSQLDVTNCDFPKTDDDFLNEQKDVVVELLRIIKESCRETVVRADYRELLDLTLFYLESLDEPHKHILSRPGATHKARWRSKLLYCIKI